MAAVVKQRHLSPLRICAEAGEQVY